MTQVNKAMTASSGASRAGTAAAGTSAHLDSLSSSGATIKLSDKPSFDMLVLGCGGGPAETDLSAYWLKPARQAWSDGFISIDGGSCLGALVRMLVSHPDALRDFLSDQQHLPSNLLKAGQIYNMLQAFLITHAHWDHISGMVLSSGSGGGQQKAVYGSKQTIANLANAMNGGLWPVLGSYEASNGVPYVWKNVDPQTAIHPSPGLSAYIMPISHGKHHGGTSYESSAYFLENDETKHSTLVFGDVEADSVSGLSLNRDVWTEASKRWQQGRLSSIFIECSYCSSRAREQLYGHLSPIYIDEELRILAGLISPLPGQDASDLTGRLKGLTVGIVHVKDRTSLDDICGAHPALSSVTSPAPTNTASADAPAPPSKRRRGSPGESKPSTPLAKPSASTSRRTRSSSQREEASCRTDLVEALKQDPNAPEGIKVKIYNELMSLEQEAKLGVQYLMLEQGMRISI